MIAWIAGSRDLVLDDAERNALDARLRALGVTAIAEGGARGVDAEAAPPRAAFA